MLFEISSKETAGHDDGLFASVACLHPAAMLQVGTVPRAYSDPDDVEGGSGDSFDDDFDEDFDEDFDDEDFDDDDLDEDLDDEDLDDEDDEFADGDDDDEELDDDDDL